MQVDLEKLNSPVLVKLLSGVIYYGDPLWSEMVNRRNQINDYFSPLGLELNIHESDGYGFLSQIVTDGEESIIPKLVKRQPLSFEVSLLMVILREEMERFEMKATQEGSLFLNRESIRELIEVYFKEKKDEVKLIKEMDKYINSVAKLGFIKEMKNSDIATYKVMPIIKARVNIEFMEEFMRKLNVI